MKRITPLQHVTALAISGTAEEIESAIQVLKGALRNRFPKDRPATPEQRPLLKAAEERTA